MSSERDSAQSAQPHAITSARVKWPKRDEAVTTFGQRPSSMRVCVTLYDDERPLNRAILVMGCAHTDDLEGVPDALGDALANFLRVLAIDKGLAVPETIE